ncbi:hypothetical protein BG005_000698 [Podila minutissima]|nr:hypothetical protein BG005_000698 [Podila minutissima]
MNSLAQLVARNDQLEELVITGLGTTTAAPQFWESVASRSRLRDVSIFGRSMLSEETEVFWNSLSHVERLSLSGVQIPAAGTKDFWNERGALTALQSIQLGSSDSILLLRLFPSLRSLDGWGRDAESCDVLDKLHREIEAGRLKQLRRLHLSRIKDAHGLSLCLEAMECLEVLDISQGRRGGIPLKALKHHLPTLQQILLAKGSKIPIKMLQTILQSCPLLTKFEATQLMVSDVIKGKPWVCAELRTLRVDVVVKGHDPDTIGTESRAVFEKLSKLAQLEHLIIRGWNDLSSCQGLDLRLESGLLLLSTLTKLQYLEFMFTIQNMSAEDIAWMKKYRTQLEQVIGRGNDHGNVKSQPSQCSEDPK